MPCNFIAWWRGWGFWDIKMSNENKRPWYRDPAYLAIIAIIAAAIISSPIWVSLIFGESDFSISINPMHGAVEQGGVITTAITIKGIHGYGHTVSLSASGQPSGIVISFVPPFGEAKPSYTSSVTINVDSNVLAGDYPIIIKGIGADGKEHSCSYTLTVKPAVTPTPTPTPSPTPSPTPTLRIKITSPKEGDEVPVSTIVSGTFSGELQEGQYIWVVINPHPSPGQWWPQGGRINPWKGQWNVQVWLGREKEDTGKEFDIAVILVNEKDDQYYRDYLKTGQETGSYPGIPLPASADIIDRITVMRK